MCSLTRSEDSNSGPHTGTASTLPTKPPSLHPQYCLICKIIHKPCVSMNHMKGMQPSSSTSFLCVTPIIQTLSICAGHNSKGSMWIISFEPLNNGIKWALLPFYTDNKIWLTSTGKFRKGAKIYICRTRYSNLTCAIIVCKNFLNLSPPNHSSELLGEPPVVNSLKLSPNI